MGHLIAETNPTGQMLAEYVYLGDQLLAMIKPGESVYYFHNDHLGPPQILMNDSQAIAWRAVYTPFGEAVPSIQTVENPFRFPGQYYDPETGLHYNYFRYYNPQTGRYITPDPIGLEGGINLFSYVQGNPVNRIDPKGLQEKKSGIWSGVGGNVGGILVAGGVFTGIYRVTSWDTCKSCWIMVTCSGTGIGLGGSLTAESIWIWNAYSPNNLAGSSEGFVVSGGKGIAAAGGSYSSGGPGNPITGPISNPSPSKAITFGAGVGLGGGYIAGGCETSVLSCK